MITYWEVASLDKAPIVAYLTYKGRLTVFQREQVKAYLPYVERLPYTLPMLERRASYGGSLPVGFSGQIAVIEGDAVTGGELKQKPAA